MPARDTVAGEATRRSWVSKSKLIVGVSGMRSPLMSVRICTVQRRLDERGSPKEEAGHAKNTKPHLVVVHHGVHGLDPHGVDGAVEHDPLLVRPLVLRTEHTHGGEVG